MHSQTRKFSERVEAKLATIIPDNELVRQRRKLFDKKREIEKFIFAAVVFI